MIALVQGLFALVARYALRIINTVFAWATVLLFGKVRNNRQVYLSAISFLSVIWILVVSGIAFPRVAALLLTFAKVPESVNPNWIRLAMLGFSAFVPAAVGALSIFMLEPARRPADARGRSRAVLKGYPYTFGLAVTLLMMAVLAPVMKLRDLLRRWETTHVPIIAQEEDYMEVTRQVQDILERGGTRTRRGQATWMLRLPTRILAFFARNNVSQFVARNLVRLSAKDLEVLLHPSDLILRGKKKAVVQAHALITEGLVFTKAYATWDKDSNDIEDQLRAIWTSFDRRRDEGAYKASIAAVQEVEKKLKTQALPYEEWEVLYREKLQVQERLLEDRLPAGDPARTGSREVSARKASSSSA